MPEKAKERVAFNTEALLASYLGEKGGGIVRDVLKRVQRGELIWKESGKIKGRRASSLADALATATAKVLNAELLTGSDEEFENLEIEVVRIRKKGR